MNRTALLLLLLLAAATITCGGSNTAQSDPDEERARQAILKTIDRQVDIMRQQLAKPYPTSGFWRDEDFAFGAYHFNQNTGAADAGLISVKNSFINAEPGDPFWEENAHWHVYLLARLYWMYSSKSTTPRMSQAAESALVEIMHAYLTNSFYVEADMVDYNYIWTYQGSENHHLQAYVSAWSAVHILKKVPEYQDMKMGDIGLAEFALKFDRYFKFYFREKATRGLLTEIASPGYAKYSLNTLYNLYDFAEDAELKDLADMFLNLYFADWAIEQFDGLRGGSKHRSYSGRTSYQLTGSEGWFPFGLGEPTKHPGFTCAATTSWRPDLIVAELALAQEDRGIYEITSRRPGLRVEGDETGRKAQRNGGQLLRYTYHTPEFIMGMSMLPALSYDAWTSISSQNRSNQILFNGTPAKIYTQRYTQPGHVSVYNAEWGVQDKGVRILQMLPAPYSKSATGQLVFFSKSLKLTQADGWVFAEADSAYCAVKVVQGNASLRAPTLEDFRDGEGDINAGTFLDLENAVSPIIFEVGKKKSYSSFDAFREEILSNELVLNGHVLTYSSKAYENKLSLYTDFSQLPAINDTTVNLNPDFVYKSPFIKGNFAQSIITISFGGKNLELDFNLKTTEGEEHVSICPGEAYQGWTKAGSYRRSYISSTGNDSIFTTHLTIASFKPTIVVNGNTLSSNEAYVAYQWCYLFGPIPGATSPEYVIKWSGDYYLRATNEAGCTFNSDTVWCKLITSSDIVEFDEFAWSVMPNPCRESFCIRFDSGPPGKVLLKLINGLGEMIEQREVAYPEVNQLEHFDLLNLSKGVYYLIIHGDKSTSSQKIIKL